VEDVRRFDALGVIAAMQPVLGNPLPPNVELWNRTLGPERASRRWPYRALSAARGSLAFGSDWPAAALNPMLGIHTAATRTTPDGEPAGGWQPAQRLPLEAAVNAYTSGAARASFDERRKGVLEAGMLADIVVLSEDIFDKGARLADARAAVTVFDGRIVYRRDRVGTD
jgi:predicted amidohydrolase YtcJ